MHVHKLTPADGVMVMQVGVGSSALAVVRATKIAEGWQVRALIAGHEEIVPTEAAAVAAAMEDVHEAFPWDRLELTPLCESCGLAAGVVRLAFSNATFTVCSDCAASESTQSLSWTRQAVA